MSKAKNRSKQENQLEMQRLRTMYDRLPDDKKAAQHAHMQKRMTELQDAINGKGPGKSAGQGLTLLQTMLLVVLFGVVALALGFFGVTYLAKT